MKIHTYQSASGRDLIAEYIDTLAEVEQVDAFSVLQCMEKGEFDKIQFKQWQKRIYEVYFYKHNRLFYIIADGNNLYLLHLRGEIYKLTSQTVFIKSLNIGLQ